jgi:hypothetical protein
VKAASTRDPAFSDPWLFDFAKAAAQFGRFDESARALSVALDTASLLRAEAQSTFIDAAKVALSHEDHKATAISLLVDLGHSGKAAAALLSTRADASLAIPPLPSQLFTSFFLLSSAG